MRLHEIFSGIPIYITAEEQSFIKKHGNKIFVTSLDEHNSYLANNLVRKGIYSISKDKQLMVLKNKNE